MCLWARVKLAREAFSRRSVSRQLLGMLYSAYNPLLSDLPEFLRQAEVLFPRLNCGLATVYLQHLLGEGIPTRGKYLGQNHTFLLLGNLAVDITADQFGGPPIYVGLAAVTNNEVSSFRQSG